jgi:ABC-type molybdate transport system substrate-binding protein
MKTFTPFIFAILIGLTAQKAHATEDITVSAAASLKSSFLVIARKLN